MPTFDDACTQARAILGTDEGITRYVETILREEAATLDAMVAVDSETVEVVDGDASAEAVEVPIVRERRGWVEVQCAGREAELVAAGWTVDGDLARRDVDPDVPYVGPPGVAPLSPLAALVVEVAALSDEALAGLSADLRARLRDEAAALRGGR